MAILIIFIVPVNALDLPVKLNESNSEFMCVVRNDKIMDKNILLARAANNQQDAPDNIVAMIKEHSSLSIDNIAQNVKPLVTTELLSSYVDKENHSNVRKTYAATVI